MSNSPKSMSSDPKSSDNRKKLLLARKVSMTMNPLVSFPPALAIFGTYLGLKKNTFLPEGGRVMFV